ncbi:MAG TPA: tetratricopeptide repeat protein [Symbiobacteriaceae bacterium]|jgi:hypothetical protein
MRRCLSLLLACLVLLTGCLRTPATSGPNPSRSQGEDPILTRFHKADGLLADGNPREAAGLLLELAAAAPDRWYVWNDLSLAYRRLDHLPAAAAAGLRAYGLKPGDPTVAFNTGVALTMAERAADALPLLKMAGTSADALYWLAVAQVATGGASPTEAKQTLRGLLERYPDDKETRVALAALDLDLDLDSKPDVVTIGPGKLTARLTAGTHPFELTWNPLDDPIPTAFQVVDVGAPYPVLLLWSPRAAWVYMYDPGAGSLKLLREFYGSGAWHYGTKTLGMAQMDRTLARTTMEDWAWREGGWRLIRTFVTGFKDDGPIGPPATPLDLGALLGEFPVRALFADDATWDAFNARWRKAITGLLRPSSVFLLPRAGAWEVEIWSDGKVLDHFAVDLAQGNGACVISRLQ